MASNQRFATALSKRFVGVDPDALSAAYHGNLPLRKDWLDKARVALAGPGQYPIGVGGAAAFFGTEKHPYDPSFGNVPAELQPQVTRAEGRGEELPSQIQNEINTTDERVQGTTTVAPPVAPTPAPLNAGQGGAGPAAPGSPPPVAPAPAPGAEPIGFGGGGNTGIKSEQLGHASTAGSSVIAAPVAAPPLAASTTPGQDVAGRIAPPTPAPAPAAPQASPSGNQGVAPTLLPPRMSPA